MILADSSVWQAYLPKARVPDAAFAEHVRQRRIVWHPWILGELMLGGISPLVASQLQTLEVLPVVPEAEVYSFIRKYHPRGVGWVDVNLLVACIESGAQLWTKDKDLHANAERHGRAFAG